MILLFPVWISLKFKDHHTTVAGLLLKKARRTGKRFSWKSWCLRVPLIFPILHSGPLIPYIKLSFLLLVWFVLHNVHPHRREIFTGSFLRLKDFLWFLKDARGLHILFKLKVNNTRAQRICSFKRHQQPLCNLPFSELEQTAVNVAESALKWNEIRNARTGLEADR